MGNSTHASLFTLLVTTVLASVVTALLVYSFLQNQTISMPVVVPQPSPVEEQKQTEESKHELELPAAILSEKITTEKVEEGYTFDFGSLPHYEGPKSGTEYFSIDELAAVLKNNDYFNVGKVIPHPTNPDQVFFSAESRDIHPTSDGTYTQTHSIYLHDQKEHTVKKIYSMENNREYTLQGVHGSLLILHSVMMDSSPGPCWNMWEESEYIQTLDLTDLKKGLQPYIVPKAQLDKAANQAAQCEKNL